MARTVAVELENRFPGEPRRSDNAIRQRKKNLAKKGATVASLEAKCGGTGRGGDNGKGPDDGGAAGGVAGGVAV